jgi:cytochrome b subunit of formate dehydrogenase
MRNCRKFAFLLLLVFLFPSTTSAQTVDDCLLCHSDPELTEEKDGKEISLYIDLDKYEKSVHGDADCIYCHADLTDTEFPHKENVEPVDCSICHDDVQPVYDKSIHAVINKTTDKQNAECWNCHGNHYITNPTRPSAGLNAVKCEDCHEDIAVIYEQSLHGQAVLKGEKLAPKCWDCHGSHDILAANSPNSRVTKFNIPFMCGTCHKEGTAVTRTYKIPQDSIITHYSESIHGVGLFQQGLTVTAVCVDCHTAHFVLPHTDPRSSIARDNVAKTCQKCHGRIEDVHQKVIKGELWEKEPHKVPVCVDCHSPHKIRKIFYEQGMADRDCMECHQKRDLVAVRGADTLSMYVDTLVIHDSAHRNISCAQCHTGATPSHTERPCATIIAKVDCSICHADVVNTYNTSQHGMLAERGDTLAPVCADCHGTHGTKLHTNPESPTYPTHVPALCSKCHQAGSKVAERVKEETNIIRHYTMSIHGKGLLESGLVVTAMCTDCHTAHHELPPENAESSVNKNNIAKTCSKCHSGIYEKFTQSIHFPANTDTDKPLPVCNDCHSSHTIERTDLADFRLRIRNQCGECHPAVTESYFQTFHGKASNLGNTAAANCSDCHGAHKILPPSNLQSTLSRENIVKTCGKCHKGSHRNFAGYLTHATHHDRTKYPILYYTFWFMSILLISTFAIFGTHTILWLPRSFLAMKEHKKMKMESRGKEVRRFKALHRRLHILVIISFIGLALTGMTLKFSYLGWAQWLANMLGGAESAGFIHRVCAVITFFYFGRHIIDLLVNKWREHKSWREFFFGDNTMLPNKRDMQQVWQTLKWFIGIGQRPAYGRWTYWEKFDYFAVFWGVAVIGTTGLILWFPEIFTRLLPGWIINVATIVHSDEALLAVGFIFTIHFFNTHFRPDKFPMDTVIFTGRVPLEEFKEDRPLEYQELVESGELEKHLVEPLPDYVVRSLKIFGAIALIIGISLILLIIYAEVFGYK